MLPQDFFEDDSATYETAHSRQPSEFIFTIWIDPDMPEGISAFIMTPLAFWKNKKKVLPQVIRPFVKHLLPPDCSEAASCFFMSHMPREELRNELIRRGFVANEAFEAYVHRPRD
jgi:hypothetical protein